MPSPFADHPRKKVVRERWDTPILTWLHGVWGARYFYFGLPGPQALDVKLWRPMIRRVVGFEVEATKGTDRRKYIVQLNRELTLLSVRYSVYCGFMENVLLRRFDDDGQPLDVDEFVTLFNLDFCNAITGLVMTGQGHRCLRFEALREIVSLQRRLYRTTGAARFVMLLTARDSFHAHQMRTFVCDPDLPPEVCDYVHAFSPGQFAGSGTTRHTPLLRLFVFKCLRDYFRGQAVSSVFLPCLVYTGTTARSPMIHFVVLGQMCGQDRAQALETQSAAEFLATPVLRADEAGIQPDPELNEAVPASCDPLSYLEAVRDSIC